MKGLGKIPAFHLVTNEAVTGYMVPGIKGLVIAPTRRNLIGESEGWAIYHEATGLGVCWAGRTLPWAVKVVREIGPLTDWAKPWTMVRGSVTAPQLRAARERAWAVAENTH
jgi:hypothetical protein